MNRRNGWRPRAKLKSPPQTGPKAPDCWFRIENRADGGAQVNIYAEIGGFGVTADAFTKDLQSLDVPEIDLRLNSPGGDVFDGIAIHNAIRNHPATVHVHVDGVAASIASVIAMAGDKVTMAKGAQMMIHEGHTVAVGNAADMSKVAALLDKTSDTIADFYRDRAGGTREQWRARMREETWYTAEEAVQAGLADEVEPPSRAVRNSWDLSVFNYAGRAKAPAPDLAKTVEPAPVAEPRPAPAPTPAPVKAQAKDLWTDLIGPLLGKSNPDAVFATLVEAL